MRLLISGYYGFGNLGDEALLRIIVARIRARIPAAEIEVLSATPGLTEKDLEVTASQRGQWRNVRRAIRASDVVLSGGGGLLQNATSSRSLLYYTGILREAIHARRKSMIFAQSIGPLDRLGEFLVGRFCKGVSRATVRDERSRGLLQRLLPRTLVERTADPVFLYDPPSEEYDLSAEGLGSDSGPYAVISVRKAPGFRDGVETVVRAVDRLAAVHGIRSAFLPLGGAPDAEVSTEIIRKCSSAPVLLPESTLDKAGAIISGAHVAVGMRLHALILAARFSVPFLALAYDPKVAALCDDLHYPLEPLWETGRRHEAAKADELIDRLIAERDSIVRHLTAGVGEIRASAERNFDVLDDLIEE
ncbi:MAG TPA: polysaccharide pyruvyl transferase CsaB [Candidatus Tumulicola sp.]